MLTLNETRERRGWDELVMILIIFSDLASIANSIGVVPFAHARNGSAPYFIKTVTISGLVILTAQCRAVSCFLYDQLMKKNIHISNGK